ncbi:MAG: PAS domain-containing protein [Rhodospirillum sp.]|nr:PAS domain-containing protein [Rhodospirillum sp.]MCF8491672.1 PAS domain-containing protein [Rhodospirillum sp.]MCF8502930.1 PAS domain-containing protein [Rhodospirillum sp.]
MILGALFLTVLALSGLVALAVQSRGAQLTLAEETVVHLASEVANSLSMELVVADMAVLDVLWGLENGQGSAMRSDLDRTVATLPDLRGLVVLGPNGVEIASNRGVSEDLSAEWLEHLIRAHRDEWREPSIWIRNGRRGAGEQVVLSRGSWTDNGTFLGVALAYNDISRLRETLWSDPEATDVKVTAMIGDQRLSLFGAFAEGYTLDVWLDDGRLGRFEEGGQGEMVPIGQLRERVVLGQVLARDFPVRVFAQMPMTAALGDWNGEVRVLLLVGVALGLAVLGFLVLYIREEKARSRAEVRLEREEARLTLALRNGHHGLVDWDMAKGYVHYSDECMLLLGEDPGSWPPTYDSWESRLHPDDKESTLATLRSHLVGNSERFEARFRMRAKDGSWRWFLAGGLVVERDGKGNPLRLVGTLGDITAEMAAQAVLEEKSKRLEESNRDLEQFAYVASHDLREPLRMVSSYLGLIRRRHGAMVEGEVGEFMGYAEDGAKRMARMINDLLDYSRVTSQALPVENCPLSKLIDGALENLTVPLRESGAVLVRPKEDPLVLGDRPQLTRVLQNLIANALKYRAKDRLPRVEITCQVTEAVVEVAVSDNGIGFDPKHADRIFLIFHRLHGQGEYEGTGIGLAICRRIIERHGGMINAEGKPGQGAVFRFTLPKGKVEDGGKEPLLKQVVQ